MVSIAQWLVAEGLLGVAQAAWATDQQRLRGGHFGEHVVDAGHLTAEEFYAALARSWRHARRNLVADPPDPALLAEVDVERAVELGWLACELADDDVVVIASCVPPTEDLLDEVLDAFPGRQPEFVSCRRDDLDSVAIAVRVERLASRRRTPPASLVRPVHVVLTIAGGVLAGVGALILPLDVLAVVLLVAAGGFLVGGVIQVLTGYALLAELAELDGDGLDGDGLDGDGGDRGDGIAATTEASGSAASAYDDEAELPLYTVIVRVCGGREGLDELFENFRSVDYPRDRTDAIIVVAEEDVDTLTALRATSPRGWVRVAQVPQADFVDVVRACDHGLALARGRYVVAYDQDERPAADQLRRAVAVFEGDLAARLSGRRTAPPLVGLRVARRNGSQPFGLDRMAEADAALRPGGSAVRGPARSSDVTAVHFNMRLLRRFGGFGLLVRGGPRTAGDAAPRIEVLDSISHRTSPPRARQWWEQQTDAFSRNVLDVAGRTLTLVRRGADRPAEETSAVAARVGAFLLLLSYPVVLGGGVAATVRSAGMPDALAGHAAWVALGELVAVVGAATGVAAALLARRRGWRAGLGALTLPVLWLLYSLAAWAALYAVLARSRTADRS